METKTKTTTTMKPNEQAVASGKMLEEVKRRPIVDMQGNIIGSEPLPDVPVLPEEPESSEARPEYVPVPIPMEAILENSAKTAQLQYRQISENMNHAVPVFDPEKLPPVWQCILDELVFTVAQNPRYIEGHWGVRDALLKLVKYGLILEDAQIGGEPLPGAFQELLTRDLPPKR